jgi:hypothetical protein
MLHTVMRPSIDSARMVLPATHGAAGAARDAGTADHREHDVFRGHAAHALDRDAHTHFFVSVRGEHVLDFRGAMPCAGSRKHRRAGVRIAADHRHAGSVALCSGLITHDALALVEERKWTLAPYSLMLAVSVPTCSREIGSSMPAMLFPAGGRRVVVGGGDH